MELLELQGMQSHPFLVLVLVATKLKLQIILVALVGLPLLLQGVEARGKGPKKVAVLCSLASARCRLVGGDKNKVAWVQLATSSSVII